MSAEKEKVIRSWEYILKNEQGSLGKGLKELIAATLKVLKDNTT